MAAGFGMNIAGTAVRAAGVDGQFATELLGAWGTWYQGKLSASMQRVAADNMRYDAKGHLEDADSYIATAGKVQRSGEEETTNRYLQLGQDIGRIYAGAAGGNIDIGSAVVGGVESSARLMANRDASAISRTAADRANAYVAQAKSSRLDYINAMTQAKMQDIQASYTKKLAKSMMRSQIISAVGGWISGHAQNAGAMMGGF